MSSENVKDDHAMNDNGINHTEEMTQAPQNQEDIMSTSIQEEFPQSMSLLAATGVSVDSSLNMPHSMPPEIQAQLEQSREDFREQAMAKVNKLSAQDPAFDPLLSMQVAEEESAVGITVSVIMLAVQVMKSQVNIMKKWTRTPSVEHESNTRNEAHDSSFPSLPTSLFQGEENKQDLHSSRKQPMEGDPEKLRNLDSAHEENTSLSPTSLAQNTQGYVRVEKTQQNGEVRLKEEESNTREVELERKLTKYKSTQAKLVEANTEWEKHCSDLTTKHAAEVQGLKDELRALKRDYERQLKQLEDTSETERAQFKSEITELRKSFESREDKLNEELARKEAAYQSMCEAHNQPNREPNKQPGTPQQQQTYSQSLEARVHELERTVMQLTHQDKSSSSTRRQGYEQPHQRTARRESARASPSRRRSPTSTTPQPHHHNHHNHTPEQVAVLQAQVSTFKEDFVNERTDKQRVETQLTHIKRRFDRVTSDNERLTAENAELRRTNEQREHESQAIRNQNEYVRTQYVQKCTELDREKAVLENLRRELSRLQGVPNNEPCAYPCPHEVCISRPPRSHWRCVSCTYDNQYQRGTCEICGHKAPHLGGGLRQEQPRLLARDIDQSDAPHRLRPMSDIIADDASDYH